MRPPVYSFAHAAMACEFGISIRGEDGGYARRAALAAFAELDRLERELSRFHPDSDIARVNSLRAGQRGKVGPDAFGCLALAEKTRRLTRGAFDVTAGRARITLDSGNHSVRMPVTGVRVDLGGIGKGYALDRMAALLADYAPGAALLHSGQSTMLAADADADATAGKEGFTFGLRHPLGLKRSVGAVTLRAGAVSGSGTSQRGRHILDPATGRAVSRPGAWAFAPTAAEADALSTAFMVMSWRDVRCFCARHPGISGIIAVDTPAGLNLRSCGTGCGADLKIYGGG